MKYMSRDPISFQHKFDVLSSTVQLVIIWPTHINEKSERTNNRKTFRQAEVHARYHAKLYFDKILVKYPI